MYTILDNINSPEDLKKLSIPELRTLCSEIRGYIIDCCSTNPGHLASSLGAVELTVGLHYVFDTPRDKIVFDVGHQAYAHKILTGRREAFRSNRKPYGLSGFPRMEESPYDAFGVGHSSTSISAALGYAEAARIQGSSRKSVALIGDGALTGGLSWEGMNNAGNSNSDILIVVNDNNQSIDSNLGGLHNHLLKITTNPAYNKLKDNVWNRMGEGRGRNIIQRWYRSLKAWSVKSYGGDIFEALGLRYFGPIDGNNIEDVVKVLRKLRGMRGPRVLHAITIKGKGYAPAEADPTVWHAPGKFDPSTGQRIHAPYTADRYQDVFGETLKELAARDDRIVGITPAMASGCGMTEFAREFPDRFFDVGIEEEHAVTFAAGLAAAGMKPVCNIYSSFAQRAFDQIIHDVALQKLPVVMCLDRAGLVGEDGATHNGVFDLASLRPVPGLVIVAPADELELKCAMYTGLTLNDRPYIIRYPRGMGEGAEWREAPCSLLPPGKGRKMRDGSRIAVLTLGPGCGAAVAAADLSAAESGTCGPAVYRMIYLKPVDKDILREVCSGDYSCIITVEDGQMEGGLYSAVCEYAASSGAAVRVKGLGVGDEFIGQDSQKNQRARCGIDSEGILRAIRELMEDFQQKNAKDFGE